MGVVEALRRTLLTRVPAPTAAERGESFPATSWPADQPARPAPSYLPWLLASLVAVGVALVATGYGLGRERSALATPVFWGGQLTAFLTALAAAAHPGLGVMPRRLVVMGFVLGQAAMTYAYSPVIFRFPDELQHVRTLDDILRTHHLFTPNPTLPVSPGFPGLEIVTTFVLKLSGLPVIVAARIVAAIAHVLLGGMVFILMRSLQLAERVATIGVVMIVASPSNIMFNGLWIYGALAIPFVWVTMVAALRPQRSGIALPTLLGLGGAFVCVVTHPSSAIFALAGLWLVLAVAVLLRDSVTTRRLLLTAGLATGFAAAWVTFRSPEVVSYAGQPFADVLRSLTGGADSATATVKPHLVRPAWEGYTAMLGVLLQAGVSTVAIWMAWRERAPRRAMIFVGSASLFFVVVALDLVSAELATRAWAYVGAFVAAAVGVVIVRWMGHRLLGPLCCAASAVVIVGNVITGWPGAWERVPGPSYVGGFESGVTAETVGLGDWAAAHLPRGTRIACDLMACSVIGAYSHATPAISAVGVFYAPHFDAQVAAERHAVGYDYVVVDRRMATQLPVLTSFFAVSPPSDTHGKVSAAAMAKFTTDPRVAKVFDDGLYAVYDVRGLPD